MVRDSLHAFLRQQSSTNAAGLAVWLAGHLSGSCKPLETLPQVSSAFLVLAKASPSLWSAPGGLRWMAEWADWKVFWRNSIGWILSATVRRY
jgi:hypothetical protein